MRTAHSSNKAARRSGAGVQGREVAGGGRRRTGGEVEPLAAMADRAPPDAALRRSRNHAELRDTVGDKRHIHGVLVEAGEKLARAVERVDKKKPRAWLWTCALGAGFFRDHRYPRHEPRQAVEQQCFRGLISTANGAVIGLQARSCRPYAHDCGGGLGDERGKVVRQAAEVATHTIGHGSSRLRWPVESGRCITAGEPGHGAPR